MASALVHQSVGYSVSFATSNFTAQLLDVNAPEESCEDIQTSHQGTTTPHTYEAGDIVENGNLEMTVHFNPDGSTVLPVVGAANETVTITFPGGGATWAFSGYVNRVRPTGPFQGKVTAEISVKCSGTITKTPA